MLHGSAMEEVARRAAETEAERFKPLFEVHWRKYEHVSAAFPEADVAGMWAYGAVSSLSAKWGLGATITPAVR